MYFFNNFFKRPTKVKTNDKCKCHTCYKLMIEPKLTYGPYKYCSKECFEHI